jgi:hypothetical protein
VAEAIGAARQAGATGTITVRADSAYSAGAFIAACRRHRARFSVTVRADPKVTRTIATIGEDAWVAIKYPNAIYDEASATAISDAEIAEVPYTAFASARAHRTAPHRTAPHRRQADRAARHTPQPQRRRAGPGRAVRHVSVSRGVHR